MGEWGITPPGARKGIQTLEMIAKERIEHLPKDVKWSLDEYTGKKGLAQVSGANWQPVWEYASMLQSLVLDYPHVSDHGNDPFRRLLGTYAGEKNEKKICKFYVRGKCNRGDACMYIHETKMNELRGRRALLGNGAPKSGPLGTHRKVNGARTNGPRGRQRKGIGARKSGKHGKHH